MSDGSHENDIAIVGMALRVPGARTIREYWKNLRDGIESIRTLTDEELLAGGEDPDRLRRPNYVRSAALLEGFADFDGEFFGFSPKESAIVDPQHRHFLETAWEALEDAGHMPDGFDGRIGVFAGCGMGSYFYFNVCSNRDLVDSVGMFLLRHTGNDKDFLATRLSYVLDLTGPSVNVQTACSTSLVAVHAGVQSLLARECDMVLAGGVTIELPHGRGYLFEEGEILSPDGHCHAFDHRAAGTVFGSGAGVVVLRRLEDALADRDHIWAVIKATAVNNDGARKVGYLAPSVEGQASAIAEALDLAGVSADAIDYVECHGTGTYLGDPIEVAALTQAYRRTTDRRNYCRIGSVKTNIGHLDTAAGVASLVKATLALHHQAIPPSLHFEKPNPNLAIETSPFVVNAELTQWSKGAKRRLAAVNSLGVGGTNAHAILAEAPETAPSTPAKRKHQPIVFSARNKRSLDGYGQKLAAHLRADESQNLADLAFTLKHGRKEFDRRRVLVARDAAEAARLLESGDSFRVFTHVASEDAPGVVFMFPGGGAQYAGMARGLYETEPVFRRYVDEGLALLRPKLDIDLAALIFATENLEEANTVFQRPSVQLPAILIVEYALAQLWMSWGVTPSALIGHSMGENTAACIAGVLSFADAIGLVHLRGSLFDTVAPGGMLSVPLPAAELEPLLGEELDLASVNAPSLSVATGPQKALDALEAKLAERGIEAQRIGIDIAAHSRMLDPILDRFGAYLKSIRLSRPKIPFVSNLTGTFITEEQATDPDYWVRHLRSTVRFADGLTTLVESGDRVFLEVGPGKALSSLARQHGRIAPDRAFSSLRHPEEKIDDEAYHLQTVARLWATGAQVAWEKVWEDEERARVSLPTYAFDHQTYFIERATPRIEERRGLEKIPRLEDWIYRPIWRQQAANLEAEMEESPSTWLLFLDDAGVGAELDRRLRARGHTVFTVEAGDAFAKRGDFGYVLAPERGREGYESLLRDLVARGQPPARIVHLWLTTARESFRPGSSFFHRNLERGFYSLFFLAQALADESIPRPVHVTVVSSGMQRVHGERLSYPEKATALGPCQVISHELPGITCLSIDLPQRAMEAEPLATRLTRTLAGRGEARSNFATLVDQLEEDLLAAPMNGTVAYRKGKRWSRAYAQRPLPHETDRNLLVDGGVTVITGGFGGIGNVIAGEIAARHRGKLVLIGRRELPPREGWAALESDPSADPEVRARIGAIRELEARGAEVLAVAADVTNVEDMRKALDLAKQRFGRIDGIVHAAGVVQDALIATKDTTSIEEVFSAKIHGTQVIDALTRDEPLAFLVLFSSTSTATAPAGQVDYVAANAFLNAYAESRADSATRVVALQWGIWSQVGMAANALTQGAPALGEPDAEPARGPLFERRATRADGTHELSVRFGSESHWVIGEHRTLSGQALLPGTGYLELAAEALADIDELRSFEVRDLFFLSPLAVPDDDSRATMVRLRRNDEGYTFEVRTASPGTGRREGVLNAQASLSLLPLPSPSSLDLSKIEERCRSRIDRDQNGLRSAQEAHLRFGPRWRVLTEIRWGAGEAIAKLSLPEPFRRDAEAYLVHPAMMDMATGYAMELIPGYDGGELWVPISYERMRFFRSLPVEARSWVRRRETQGGDGSIATFDVTITDLDGSVCLDVEGFSIKRLEGSLDFGTRTERPAGGEGKETRALSPAEEQLRRNLERGIRPAEGAEAFCRVLSSPPASQVIVTSLDLHGLIEQADRTATETVASETKFSRPDLDSDYVAPRDEIERTLVGFWEELLGVDKVGVRDSFFDLGGHSLIAVRLFAKIKRAYRTEFPISALFEAPTIEGCARLVREARGEEGSEPEAPRRRYTHLVSMHTGEGGKKRPFFLVAGMFGNVLNLRHLAQLVGTDRPFFGLQARGLYGNEAPHETFEEMAEAYLAEMRTVQAKGPYLLGGFSGGGITAYEIAQKLRAEGDEVALLVMLDTPLPKHPPLLARDRAILKLENIKQGGTEFVAEWARGKVRWEMNRLRRRFEPEKAKGEDVFHDTAIEAAFRRALDRYEVKPYPGPVALFRPKLAHPTVKLGEGRVVDLHGNYVFDDNAWGRYVTELEVHEVPGDHDSMVLEPNVRVLAAQLRRCIERVDDPKTDLRARAAE